MTFPECRERPPRIGYLVIVILPFFLFYWMLPFVASHSIGQDYQTIGIQSQMELFFSIRTGSFPLYVPGFAYGTSSSTLTLGQLYHPIAYIASILPGYWSGKALEWNTFLRVLSLGLTQLALFAFLRKIKLNMLFSFLLSFITVYNLRMLDLFRYGASLEAYTGYLLLCAAIGLYFITPTRRLGPLSIIGLTYWLVCSGHTQMMYYGLLGAGLFTLVVPFFLSSMLTERDFDMKIIYGFLRRTALFLTLGIVLSTAYILPFYFDFIVTNVGRVGQSYAWADSYRDTFVGTLNSFFLPFRSDVHGNFGGSSLFIVALIFPVLRLFRVKIPHAIWAVWGLFLLLFLYMQGGRTPVHRLVWEYFPFASSFRIAGRISLILPVFIMLILSWLVRAEPFKFYLKGRTLILSPLSVLASLALIAMSAYYLLIAISVLFSSKAMLDFAHFIPVNIHHIPHPVEILIILSGVTALFSLVLYGAFPKKSGLLGIVLCIATLVQVGCILKFGTWVVERRDKPTFDQMLSQKKEKLDYRHHPGSGLYSSVIEMQIKNSFVEPFPGKIYFDIIPVAGQEEAYALMRQNLSPQRVYVEGYRERYAPINADDMRAVKGRVELVYSSFNRLRFRVFSSANALFSISYPYTGYWNAWVNDREERVYRSNGAACGVSIPEGESVVEFRYWSDAAFWGMVISDLTFLLVLLYFSFQSANGFKKTLSIVVVLFISIGVFTLWYHSLYSGDNLGTKYIWTYKAPRPVPNLAYGKKTLVSSALSGGFYIPRHSSKTVDGDLRPGSGFSTAEEENPFLVIDLAKVEKIGSILLYESAKESATNLRPLQLAFSIDGLQWYTEASVSDKNHDGPIQVPLEATQSVRFVRILATGNCRLALDEVEVYGPEGETLKDEKAAHKLK